jgi:hypothetical protein
MKLKILSILLILVSGAAVYAQSNSDITGTWEIIVKRSGLKNYPSPVQYTVFNNDGSYIWGIDSANADPLQSVSKGRWELTDDGVKMMPQDQSRNEIIYYKKSGDDILRWNGSEMNGKKENVMLEMSIYLQRKK